MAKPISPKTASGLTALILSPVVTTVMLVPFFICDKLYPETAVGISGLEQVRTYCIAMVLSYLGAMLLLPVLFWLYCALYRVMCKEDFFSRKGRIITDVIVMVLYIIAFPRVSQFDVQARENGYPDFPLIQTCMLWHDINKDLRGQESVSTAKDTVELGVVNVHYKVRSGGKYSSRMRTITNMEYGLYDANDNLLGQLAQADYNTLSKGIFRYIPHSIETFSHSGLIKSIDGEEEITPQPFQIELAFDYDAGFLRRELLCEDEELLPDMVLWTTMDGEYAGSNRINGQTEIRFKPMIPGHAEAWIELRPERGASSVISNVITYDQTAYVDWWDVAP